MTQKTLILTVSVIFILGGLAFIFLQNGSAPAPQTPPTDQAAQPTTQPDTAQEEPVNLAKSFEDTLNTLLLSVQKQAQSYSAQRATLFALMSPQAISASQDLNAYTLDVQRQAAVLRAAIDEIMLSFERANARVDDLLYTQVQDEETRKTLLDSWQAMKSEQVSLYLNFFNHEEQIITAQLNLMALYAAQDAPLTYDAQTKRLLLGNPQDQAKADEILSFIDELQKEQAQAVKG